MAAILLATVAGNAPSAAIANDEARSFKEDVQPFLKKHCYECHGSDRQEAQLRFDQVGPVLDGDGQLWTMIHEQLSASLMPPEQQRQPGNAERRAVLVWIEQIQQDSRDPIRRLNRRELSAALKHMTGLANDFTHSLPQDGEVNGFDTGAEGLQDSADSVARIMETARRAVNGIRLLEPADSAVFEADLAMSKDPRRTLREWKDLGARASTNNTFGKNGSGLLIKPKWIGERGGLTIHIPAPEQLGVLRLLLQVTARKHIEGVPDPRLWVDVGGRNLAYEPITNSPENPRTLVYQVHLKDVAIEPKGIRVELSNRVELPYSVAGFENEDRSDPDEEIPGGTGLFRPLYDRKTLPPEEQPVPFIVLHSIKVEPDFRVQWPTAEMSTGIDAAEITDSREGAQRLIRAWMRRAWRRPIESEEASRFVKLYGTLRHQGLTFDEALRASFQSILMSGSFRYLTPPAVAEPSHRQYAVASRLSFMLWGRPPDDQLRTLAASGRLDESRVLDQQVDRLLMDPRSEGFYEPFVIQWLEMDQPITYTMDYLRQQHFRFGRYLKASMTAETIAYFETLVRENRPATALLASDWTMMNDVLAWHYGYEGVDGGELRKVRLRDDDPRGGGILGHAGIQSMLCWMGENWVIYRGVWTLRNLLDDPLPPPPLDVPELTPSEQDHRGKSFRELLAQHQEDDRCTVCHKKIDPLGFAFQSFDISGRWREVEHERYVQNDLDGKVEWRGEGETRPVDASGKLPRGETFDSFGQCKELLVRHYRDDFVLGLLKNLLLYGTGRVAGVEDIAELRAIMKKHEADGYPMRGLIKSLVTSKAF